MLVVGASIGDGTLQSFPCHFCSVGGANGGAASPQGVAADLDVSATAACTSGVPRGVLVVRMLLLLLLLLGSPSLGICLANFEFGGMNSLRFASGRESSASFVRMLVL